MIRKTASRVATIRFLRFALVGGSGVLVNLGTFWLLVRLGLPVSLAGAAAIETSVLTNFVLNDRWTWREAGTRPGPVRLVRYHVSVAAGALLTWGVLLGLHHGLGVNPYLAQLAGIGGGTLLNYLLNDVWTYGVPDQDS